MQNSNNISETEIPKQDGIAPNTTTASAASTDATATNIPNTSDLSDKDPDAVKLFIGQIPKSYTESDLREVLEPYGPIHELIVLRDKITQAHKGCAFVTFYHRSSAEKAIAELHDKRTLGDSSHPLQVKPAENDANRESKLFVGMLSKTTQEDELQILFSPFGNIEDISILRNPDGTSKGCAFVKFNLRQEAQKAIENLDGIATVEGATNPITVKFADTDKQRAQRKLNQQMSMLQSTYPMMTNMLAAQQSAFIQPNFAFQSSIAPTTTQFTPFYQVQTTNPPTTSTEISFALQQQQYAAAAAAGGAYTPLLFGQPINPALVNPAAIVTPQKEGPEGANLFIYHLPPTFMDADLLTTFAPFGNVISAKVFIDKKTGQSKCFGFISYDNPSSGAAAIQNMNGFYVAGKRLKVQLKQKKNPY